MSQTGLRKQGNHSRVHVAPVQRSPEELFERELADGIASVGIGPGKKRPRRLYKIVEDELHPGRSLMRVLGDALGVLCDPVALYWAIDGAVRRYIERKTRRRLPAPPQHKALPGA